MSDSDEKIALLMAIYSDSSRAKSERAESAAAIERLAPHLKGTDGRILTQAIYDRLQQLLAKVQKLEAEEKN